MTATAALMSVAAVVLAFLAPANPSPRGWAMLVASLALGVASFTLFLMG